MNNSLKAASVAAIALGVLATPAFAQSTQESIESCRVAMTDDAKLDMEAYRLKFKSSKGTRTKTLKLEAIPTSTDGDRVKVKCVVSRKGKVELTYPENL